MARVTHFFQSNAAKIGLTLPDFYTDIGPVVGMARLGANDAVDALVSVGEALRQGLVVRMKLSYTLGTEKKVASIVCDIDKSPTAKAGLIGKQYNGGTITSASFPRRRRLG